MGAIEQPEPVVRIAAIFSRHKEALQWATAQCVTAWGEVAVESEIFQFDFTTYYEPSMGAGLLKQLVAFAPLTDPSEVVEAKLASNRWEQDYAAAHLGGGTGHSESRPVNIDPGYVSQAKLVLATTKDRDHRIYLRDGIYAEVTLHYRGGNWKPHPWTYADYQTSGYAAFLTRCRDYLRAEIRKPASG